MPVAVDIWKVACPVCAALIIAKYPSVCGTSTTLCTAFSKSSHPFVDIVGVWPRTFWKKRPIDCACPALSYMMVTPSMDIFAAWNALLPYPMRSTPRYLSERVDVLLQYRLLIQRQEVGCDGHGKGAIG